MTFCRRLAYLLILLCFTTVAAQDTGATCTAIVQQAMTAVEQDCAPTGRNQACYGYVSLEATPREGVQDFTFAQEGDLVSVADIRTIRLSRLDTANNTWGIALMKLQANLPDALPGQNVTFLLFGDVQIQNAVAEPGAPLPTIDLSSNGNVNIRSTPSTSSQIVGTLARGETVTANGRNGDSTWLRIQIPDSDALGWVFRELVTPASDASVLNVVDSTDVETPFTPMQAFYFQTGITQTDCAAAPADGILIQTPEGAGQINLRANDVDIQLGSTAFLQAQANANMTVSVVEGEGQVTAEGETVTVPAGTQVTIPVDENLQPSGAPSDPQPYDETVMSLLPIEVLPQQITVAPPLTPDQIEPTQAAGVGGGFPGGFDPSMFSGLSASMVCQMLVPALSAEGMSISEYISLMQQYSAMVPADSRAQFDQFIQMLSACPS